MGIQEIGWSTQLPVWEWTELPKFNPFPICDIKTEIDDCEVRISALVVDNKDFTEDVIVGVDTLQKYNIGLDFGEENRLDVSKCESIKDIDKKVTLTKEKSLDLLDNYYNYIITKFSNLSDLDIDKEVDMIRAKFSARKSIRNVIDNLYENIMKYTEF